MDITGFITGLPGLVTACTQIYELTVTARRVGDEGVLLIYKIVIEQAKFQAWLEDAGWLSYSGPNRTFRPVMQKVIFDTLQGIKLTMKSLGAIINKYELDEGGKVTNLHFALPDRFWKFSASGSRGSAEELSQAISKRIRGKRLKWAAGDATLARTLIDDLRKFNEDLRVASGDMRRATFSMLPSKVLPQVFDDDNLKRLIEASAEGDPDLSRCATIKKEVLDTIKGSEEPPDPKFPTRRSMISIKDKEPGAEESKRLAIYTPQPGTQQTVILEDKFYATNDDDEFAEKRVQEISQILAVTPKSEKLRVLDCLGYVPMRQRKCFTFIYSFPAGADPTKKPISLSEILPSGTKSVPKPSLSSRFAMARSLGSSLLLLQACGILHKGLKPENIVFFKFATEPEYHLSRPYIIGFECARLRVSSFTSESMEVCEPALSYTHPDYNFSSSQRYVEIFDIYSLGLVLLQVGLWKDLFSILREWTGVGIKTPVSRIGFQETIVSQIKKLEPEVGEVFTRAIARCITGDLGHTGLPTEIDHSFIDKFVRELQIDTSQTHEEVQRYLERNVVLALEKCVA